MSNQKVWKIWLPNTLSDINFSFTLYDEINVLNINIQQILHKYGEMEHRVRLAFN